MEQYAEPLDFQLSNSDVFVKFSLEISGTLCYAWENADYATKLRLQNLVFLDGMTNDKETNNYRTSKINPLFGIILSLSSGIEEKRKGRPSNVDESSFLVDKVIEISNLDSVRDLIEINDFLSRSGGALSCCSKK